MKHSNISIFIPHNGCPCKCSFCNQSRITGQNSQPTTLQVRDIIESGVRGMGEKVSNCEIAFFGGSFTAIDRDYMIDLLDLASKAVKEFKLMGIRISTRPDAIDREILTILKHYGVTSIELGAQSMSDEVLKSNSRGHDSNSVRIASELITAYGFELGIQMMTGLYGSSDELDYYSAVEITKLSPKSVRIYPTVVLLNTELCNLYRDGKYQIMSLDDSVELCSRIIELFTKREIKILRVGLHATDEIINNRVAGAYHPAFMELCLGRIFLRKLMIELEKMQIKRARVLVNPKKLSYSIGQKKENLNKLSDMGYDITITANQDVADFLVEEV